MAAFREVEPGSHFLGCAHTMERYRDVFYRSKIADSDSFEQWQEAGSMDATTRANKLWKQKLEEYTLPQLDPAIDEAVCDFISHKKSLLSDSFA